MRFVDTHTHPYDEAFDGDRAEVLQRALDCGVVKWVLPAIDISSYKAQSSLAKAYPANAFMTMGLHPTSVGANWKDELDFVEKKLSEWSENKADADENYVAVGEIGLDGYWSKEFMKEQLAVFSAQVDLALKYDLPIIIHERNAQPELFDVLDGKPHTVRGVFHAFSGSYETYCRIKKYGGFKIGIGGVVTFKNAGVAASVEKIPLQDIVLETDSPWLTPAPYRGKRNESSYIPLIANKIAEIKQERIERIAGETTKNAEELFRI